MRRAAIKATLRLLPMLLQKQVQHLLQHPLKPLFHTFFLFLSVKMTKIKLALCQMNVVDDKEANLKKAHSMIVESAEKNADFIILPEMFNCPYSNEKFIEYGEDEHESCSK